MCNSNVVDDEIHLLCECESYSDYRTVLFSNATATDPEFPLKDIIDKFVYLMSNHQKSVISFLTNAVYKRMHSMYVLENRNH